MRAFNEQFLSRYDSSTAQIAGATPTLRYLADLKGCFADTAAYEAALRAGNPLLYSVASVEPAGGDGDLHYALAQLMPGRIGSEYADDYKG